MKYIVKEVFTTKRDTLLSSWIEQARDEQRQTDEYIKSKLGDTYVWIKEIYTTADMQKQILYAQCANTFCGENFLIYRKNVPE